MCTIEDFNHLKLCYMHGPLVQQELPLWHKHYLPYMKKEGMVDGGAGCGETVQLYLNHGCKQILAIECNPECLRNLQENFGTDKRVQIVDFKILGMKFDIEGFEKHMLLEVHFPYRMKRLAGFPYSTTSLNVLVEDWGNAITKARRLAGKALIR